MFWWGEEEGRGRWIPACLSWAQPWLPVEGYQAIPHRLKSSRDGDGHPFKVTATQTITVFYWWCHSKLVQMVYVGGGWGHPAFLSCRHSPRNAHETMIAKWQIATKKNKHCSQHYISCHFMHVFSQEKWGCLRLAINTEVWQNIHIDRFTDSLRRLTCSCNNWGFRGGMAGKITWVYALIS